MTPLRFDYPISVGILYYDDNSTGDNEDTVECMKGLKRALESRGHLVRTMALSNRNWRRGVTIPGEVIFNLVEDEGWKVYCKVGRALEELGKAQVGHDLYSFKYLAKKARIKRRMQKLGISTPRFKIYNRRSRISDIRSLDYPVILKPSGQHAGIGISQESVVIDGKELKEGVQYLFKNFPGEVIAEEYVEGREIHVTVIGNGRHIVALPYCELEFGGEFKDNWNVYTYNAKWEDRTWEYWDARIHAPALVSRSLDRRLERLAVKAYRVFNCHDIARFDIRVDEKEKAYIIDVNMNPSLNMEDDQDATNKSVEAMGWTYEEFIETVIAMSYKRVYGKLPDRVRERQFLLTSGL